jgi:hypothetical protein
MLRKIYNFICYFNTFQKIKNQDKTDLKIWLKTGLKLPPPEVVKHRIILKYAKKEKIRIFVADENYLKLRFPLLEINFELIIKIMNHSFIDDFENKLISINKNAIIWIDTQQFLQFETQQKILDKITEFIKLTSQTKENHVLL